MDEDNTGFPENEAAIYTPQDRAGIVARVNHSVELDFLGERRRLADKVSTSEALTKRARAQLNGHH